MPLGSLCVLVVVSIPSLMGRLLGLGWFFQGFNGTRVSIPSLMGRLLG